MDGATNGKPEIVKVGLSEMKRSHSRQLVSFYGILDFGVDTEYINATIVACDLGRQDGAAMLTKQINSYMSKILRKYNETARLALLFTKRIFKISYTEHNTEVKTEWSISKQVDSMIQEDAGDSFELIHSVMRSSTTEGTKKSSWIAFTGQDESSIECKVAIPVPSDRTHSPQNIWFDGLLHASIWELPFCARFSMATTNPYFRNSNLEVEGSPEISGDVMNIILKRYMEILAYATALFGHSSGSFWPGRYPDGSLEAKFTEQFWGEVRGSKLGLFASCNNTLPPLTFSYSDAVFDFTPESTSNALRRVFFALNIRRVVRPDVDMAQRLQELGAMETNIVDPVYVRSLLKNSEDKHVLLELWRAEGFSCGILNKILEFVVENGRGLSDMVGCICLPLMNETLGILNNVSL
jgi:hypothetical protein